MTRRKSGLWLRLLAITSVTAAMLAGMASPASAAIDSYRNGTVTIYSTTYQAVTNNMTNYHAGYNKYWRVDNGINTTVYGRWVKCGYSSTQDTASSVGGSARATNSNPFQGEIGSSFIYGACTKLWNRKVTVTTYQPVLAYETYFSDRYLL